MTDLVNIETETRTIVLKQIIEDGDTTHAPSGDAVYDALAGKSSTGHGHTVSDISDFPNLEFVKIVIDKGTASASTMGHLYIEVGVSTTDVYYTVRSGSEGSYTYSWEKLEDAILDDVSIDWDDVQDKPSTFTPSSHTHGNIDNGGVLKISGTAQASMNVVTDASGNVTAEAKPTIPTASSSTPSADVSGGAVGSGTTWAKADHQHPLSSAYATANHGHTYSDLTSVSTLSVTITYTDTTTENKDLLVYEPPL